MLDNERYNLSVNSLQELIKKGRLLTTTEANKQRLFSEQYNTQVALQNLPANKDSAPSNLPMIGKLIVGDRSQTLMNSFSLIGMPNSGRTSTLIDLAINQPDLFWIFGDAARRSFGMLKKREVGTDFAQLTVSQSIRSKADMSYSADSIYVASMLNEVSESTNVVFERDMTDLPFVRANFLFGRIDVSMLELAEDNFIEYINKTKGISKTVISCLVRGNISLERETEQKEHLVVQDKFLSVLYEQYLRFHYEMLNFENFFGQNIPFNYLAIDMSEKDIRENVKSLKNNIKHISELNKTWKQQGLF